MNTIERRNLAEQVLKNKEDILKHFQRDEVLADFGIRIIGTVQDAEELEQIPTAGLQYGDAYAVGTQSPYDYYIWTRANNVSPTDYWFNFGEIAIAGPAGPMGPRGLKGKDGESTRWYYYADFDWPSDQYAGDYHDGDMVLDSKGDVYMYGEPYQWARVTNIRGARGAAGRTGPQGETGPQGPQGEKGERGDVGGFINIVGIVDSEELLPDPSLLDNLTYAYLVGLSNPRLLYIQVGENSDEAQWFSTGSFNAATLVTVNGQSQNMWEANTKRDRITGLEPYRNENDELPSVVYTQDNGVDEWSLYSTEPEAAAFALWSGSSTGPILKSDGTPTENNHVVNKAYFDSIVNNIGTGHVRTYVFDSLDKSRWDSTTINALYELVDYANDIYFQNYKEVLQTDKIFMLRNTPASNVPEYLLPYDVNIERTALSNHQAAYRITFRYLRHTHTDNLIDIQITLATNHEYMGVNIYQNSLTNQLLDWQNLNANLAIPRRVNIPHMPGSDKVGQYFNGDNADDYLYSELRDMVETIATYEYLEQYGDGAAYEGCIYDFWYYDGNQFTKIYVEEGDSEDIYIVTIGYTNQFGYKEWTVVTNIDEYTFLLDAYQEYTFQRI